MQILYSKYKSNRAIFATEFFNLIKFCHFLKSEAKLLPFLRLCTLKCLPLAVTQTLPSRFHIFLAKKLFEFSSLFPAYVEWLAIR